MKNKYQFDEDHIELTDLRLTTKPLTVQWMIDAFDYTVRVSQKLLRMDFLISK